MLFLPPASAGDPDVGHKHSVRIDVQDSSEVAIVLGIVIAIGRDVPEVADYRCAEPVAIQMNSGLSHLAMVFGIQITVRDVGLRRIGLAVHI